jgi:hypothetical protein
MTTKDWIQYVVPIVVVGIVLAFRFRSMGRARPLNLRKIWIMPTVLVAIAGITLATHPPSALGLGLCLVALIAGAAIGWHRGKLMRIAIDPQTGQLNQTASPAAMLLLLGIIAVRYSARAYFGAAASAGSLDERTLLITDVLLLFAVGLLTMTRVEMALRARRMLAAGQGPTQ